jgi:hypothetical protein
MRPLECHPSLKQGNATVERENQLRAKICLPRHISSLIRKKFQLASNRLTYILMSETQEQQLRVLFPSPAIVSKLAHIAFEDDDVPGALAAVLKIVALAEFNILQGLTRKPSESRNSWEAILEYRGSDQVPESDDQFREWWARRLSVVSDKLQPDEIQQLRTYNIHIRLPAYPNRRESWKGHIILNELLHTAKKDD